MEKCEHQKVSKQSGKRAYASKYLGNCHPNYVGFNSLVPFTFDITLLTFATSLFLTFS